MAKETFQIEKEQAAEQQSRSATAAPIEMFLELETDKTPAVRELIAADIDAIVQIVRFLGWQQYVPPQNLFRRIA